MDTKVDKNENIMPSHWKILRIKLDSKMYVASVPMKRNYTTYQGNVVWPLTW